MLKIWFSAVVNRCLNILFGGGVACAVGAACFCEREVVIPIKADFEVQIKDEDFTIPVEVSIKNTSHGADTYTWIFEGADTKTATVRNPKHLVYHVAGDHSIYLKASNKDGAKDEKEITLQIDPAVAIDFRWQVLGSLSAPVTLQLIDSSAGAANYRWIFSDGLPPTSTEKAPKVVFKTPGTHRVALTLSNGREFHSIEKTIDVAPELEVGFRWRVAFIDEDYQAPVELHLENTSVQATAFQWNAPGALPENTTDKDPVLTFQNTGDYTISLIASNDKMSKSIDKTITISPDTNLLSFRNIKLGISTSKAFAPFFAATLGKAFYPNEDLSAVGDKIEVVYYGFDASFSQGFFGSPDNLGSTNFKAIPNAGKVTVINLQEALPNSLLSATGFDAIDHGQDFESIDIKETAGVMSGFDKSVLPRVVLLKTADGRKGALKITNFVFQGIDSHIVVDMKIQKTPQIP